MNGNASEQQAWLMTMNIGKQSFQQGRMGDAVNAFTQATKLQPTRIESWVNLGSALLESRRFEAAVAALGNATRINPKVAATQMLLGDAFRQLGEYTLALQSYGQAVALKRTPLALNKLACALRVTNQLDESKALYNEAIRLDPAFSLARVNLATLNIEALQFDDARALLNALSTQKLGRMEREEVDSSQRALDEYFRLEGALAQFPSEAGLDTLQTALAAVPEEALQVDNAALDSVRRYMGSIQQLKDEAPHITGTPPAEWPLIEALFMVPLVGNVDEFLSLQAQLAGGEQPTGDVLESVNMEAAVIAARNTEAALTDPLKAELHLRHWHALACRDLDGFMPGHFKYTQNWTTRNPTLKRVDPALASGTFRHFIREYYSALPPGLARAALVFVAVCDLHAFADGNGRVALTWMNRELEWAGLMPAIFSRDLGIAGKLGDALKAVRNNGGDLTPLYAAIAEGQNCATDFCAQLQDRSNA